MQSLVARSIIHFLTLPKRTLFTSELILFHHKIKQTIFIEIFIYGIRKRFHIESSKLAPSRHIYTYLYIKFWLRDEGPKDLKPAKLDCSSFV